MDLKNAHITAAQTFTDSLFTDPIEQLAEQLIGIAYRPDAVAECLDSLIETYPNHGAELQELKDWLVIAVS